MEAHVIEVIEVRHVRGEGRNEGDVCRQVVAYYGKDGALLAEHDGYIAAVTNEVTLAMGNRCNGFEIKEGVFDETNKILRRLGFQVKKVKE